MKQSGTIGHATALLSRRAIHLLALLLMLVSAPAFAQQGFQTGGTVVDSKGETIIGASVIVKGSKGVGTVTDMDGNFKLSVPSEQSVLVISYVGMKTQELKVAGKATHKVTLEDEDTQLGEVIVVGYGQQKKASVVGAITQTTGKALERAGGVSSLGAALTGALPGVITSASSGMPGDEDPKIIIRTQSSWNSSEPLILVDGIEREMSSVDISSVESISVLKDASATAVYGVKGANGVILITTKRGSEGKAQVQVKANMTLKVASQLPEKLDAYDTFGLMNQAIERQAPLANSTWAEYSPQEVMNKYRNPANTEEWDRYPNTDWEKELFKGSTMSYNASVNVAGGTKVVRYFAAADFVSEGDLFRSLDSGRGYNTGFGYNRLNVRSNLDFNLTKTTKFSTNLFGSNAVRRVPWNYGGDGTYWAAAYKSAPDAMRSKYSNGMWGWYAPKDADVPNSAYKLATAGNEKRTTTKITTDFILQQDLKMITPGLSFKADMSLDYTFLEKGRGVNDMYHDAQCMWVDPNTGDITYKGNVSTGTGLDYPNNKIYWTTQAGSVDMSATFRKLYYSLQLDYSRKFGKHEVTGLALFSRQENATGSEFSHYREDWVGRVTYNYAMRYFFEANGAYNGSEKFGPSNRFAFFPSLSAGWMITEEKFMRPLQKWIDMIKFRASWGRIGDDSIGGRWLYQDQWALGGNYPMGDINPQNSPYTFYYLKKLGNPNISWETVEKRNFGVDYALLGGWISGSFDYFTDTRDDILVAGSLRSVPSYFGQAAPDANLGKVNSHGYELEVKLQHTFPNGIHAWLNSSLTHAINEVKFKDDAPLKPAYQKAAGHTIGQTYAWIDHGNLSSWDDVLGSTNWSADNQDKLAGDYNIVDFNCDGVIDDKDKAPYQYSSNPQNTWNCSIGAEWKGWSIFAQFYGVNNVTREVRFPTFQRSAHVAYAEGNYWSPATQASLPMPRLNSAVGDCWQGTRYLYDGSYVRLKNVEISYTFQNSAWLQRAGINRLRLYVNGDNLFLWTDMPDDRESNLGGGSSDGAYPTMRRFNFGVDITL